MKQASKIILLSVIAAIVITILSGFVNVTPQGLVGATWYGWPFAWRYIIVYPGSPENYDFKNVGIDALLWFVLIVVVATLVSSRFSKPK